MTDVLVRDFLLPLEHKPSNLVAKLNIFSINRKAAGKKFG